MIRLMGNRLLVKRRDYKKEEVSPAGIILNTSVEKPAEGNVIAIGDEVKKIKIGDNIIFGKFAPIDIKYKDVDYIVMFEDDVIAVGDTE